MNKENIFLTSTERDRITNNILNNFNDIRKQLLSDKIKLISDNKLCVINDLIICQDESFEFILSLC